jgi:hypothetical protein
VLVTFVLTAPLPRTLWRSKASKTKKAFQNCINRNTSKQE